MPDGVDMSLGELVTGGRRQAPHGAVPTSFKKGQHTAEKLREAGRKGAAVANAKKRQRREVNSRFIEEALRARADEMLDEIIAPYFSALELKPDPNWSPSTKLRFYLEQTTASEKIASRLEGLPVARRREVDEEGHDRARISELSQATIERVLAGALSSGNLNLDEIEIDAEDVVDVEEVKEIGDGEEESVRG